MRLFPLLFGAQIFSKKFLGLAALFTTIGVSVHFGVSKPIQKNKEVMHLIGSQPLLEKYRGNPYERRSNEAYLVKDFQRSYILPSMSPALSINHVHASTKSDHLYEFNGSMRKYLSATLPPSNKNYQAHLLDKARNLRWMNGEFSSIAEIEIPYKSHMYNSQVRDMGEKHIVQDILWSLVEESGEKKMVIRPDSIDVNFQLEKTSKDLDEEFANNLFPLSANKVRNFQIRLKAYNPNNEVKTIFKSIPLLPYQESEISIFLERAEIRPFHVSFYPDNARNSIKWGLIPFGGSKFHITQSSTFPNPDSKSFTLDKMPLIYGKSRFVKKVYETSPSVTNSPVYQDFSNLVTPALVGITTDQIKKDLEVWYGAAAAFHTRLRLKDFQNLAEVMEMDIFRDKSGNHHDGLDMLVNSSSWRDALYQIINLQSNVAKVIEKFFDSSPENKAKVTYKEAKYLIRSLAWATKEMQDNMKIKITWHKEPEFSQPNEDDNSPFQAVSFKFSQEISWSKKVVFPFKGCWKDDKFDENISDQNNCNNGEGWFDFSDKLDRLSEIVSPIADLIGPFVMKLLPDASKFVGWSQWEIDKDEKIVTTYEAKNSPIRPSISNSSDFREKREVVAGWKAMDVSTSYDLSNFHKFFYKIYEKIDTYKNPEGVNITNWYTTISGSFDIVQQAKDNPIAFAIHMINQLWDKNYWQTNQGNTTEEDKKPWPTFFKSLLCNPLLIESTQLFAGYSLSMFDVEDWVHTSLHTSLHTMESGAKVYETKKDWQKKENNTKKDISDQDWDFPAKFKSKKLQDLLENYSQLFSSYFPRNSLIFEFVETPEWLEFLKYEGSTSLGFINNRILVKNIIENMVYKHSPSGSFPRKQLVDWGKVKISFTQLHLERAIKSVLGLQNHMSTVVDRYLSIPLNIVLGEYIRRDAMWVTVNMMIADGSVMVVKNIMNTIKLSPYSTFGFTVQPNLDQTKLHTSIRTHLGLDGEGN